MHATYQMHATRPHSKYIQRTARTEPSTWYMLHTRCMILATREQHVQKEGNMTQGTSPSPSWLGLKYPPDHPLGQYHPKNGSSHSTLIISLCVKVTPYCIKLFCAEQNIAQNPLFAIYYKALLHKTYCLQSILRHYCTKPMMSTCGK